MHKVFELFELVHEHHEHGWIGDQLDDLENTRRVNDVSSLLETNFEGIIDFVVPHTKFVNEELQGPHGKHEGCVEVNESDEISLHAFLVLN